MPAYAVRFLSVLVAFASAAMADDWPQWMGPRRDNVWREDGLLEKFPKGGPRIVWRAPVAGGYAGPAVAEGRLFVTDYETEGDVKVGNFERKEFTGMERVLCLDAASGRELWKHEYPVKYTISYPAGPRCTPVVDNGKVYTLGAEGNLICFNADSNRVVWQRNLPQEYNTKTALWGYSNHPLIDGEKLICIVGGEGTHAVAFNKNTGEEIWRALTSPEQGYSPPAILEMGGRRQLVLLRPDAVTALDPETGRDVYWSVPFDADSGLVVMTPIRWESHLFVGGYDSKNMLLKLSRQGTNADVAWRGDKQRGVSPVNVQPAIDGDILYGVDHQDGKLYAVDLATGDRRWGTIQPVAGEETKRPVRCGTAFIVKQGDTGDRYWLFNDSGDLIIANLTPEGYDEIDRAHLIEPTNFAFGREVVWSMPAFANKRMYVRNDKEIICVELGASK